jgi:hypothetical protein
MSDQKENFKKSSEKIRVVVLDVSNAIEQKALDVANDYLLHLTEPEPLPQDASRVRRLLNALRPREIVRRVWRGNIMREYYRTRERYRALGILREQGYYAFERQNNELTQEEERNAVLATIERFISDYEETIHNEVGELREFLNDQEIQNMIRNILEDYVAERIDRAAFETRINEILTEIARRRPDLFREGYLTLNNLLEIGEQLRVQRRHEKSLNDLEIEFIIGRARPDVRTEAQFNRIDRVIDALNRNRVVSAIFNETTVAGAVSTAWSITTYLSQRFLRNRLVTYGTFGASALLGGAVAALRESHVMEIERMQHLRERAGGAEAPGQEAIRRMELENSVFFTHEVPQVIEELNNYILQLERQRQEGGINYDTFNNATNLLAEITAAIRISDTRRIDLLRYSNPVRVGTERFNLDVVRAQLRFLLRSLITENRIQLPNNQSFEDYLNNFIENHQNRFTGESEERNRVFRRLKRHNVGIAFLKGTLIGAGIGLAVQEAASLFLPKLEGLLEEASQRNSRLITILADLKEFITGRRYSELPIEIHQSGNYTLKLPTGYSFSIKDNYLEIFDQNKHSIFHGTLDDLKKDTNFGVIDTTEIRSEKALTTLTAKNFIEENRNLFSRISRNRWLDNGTPRHPDYNELKLWWGSKTGFDQDGNAVFTVKQMKPDGSWFLDNGSEVRINIKEAIQKGEAHLAISLNQKTQNDVLLFPIEADGTVKIPQNHPLFNQLFELKNGKPIFKGRFAEVVQVIGEKDGIKKVNIFATTVGNGLDHLTGTQEKLVENVKHIISYKPQEPIIFIQPPPLIPIFGRRGLERLERPGPEPYFPKESYYFLPREQKFEGNRFLKRNRELKSIRGLLEHSIITAALPTNLERREDEQRENFQNYLENLNPFLETYFKYNNKENVLQEFLKDQNINSYSELVEKLAREVGPMSENCRCAVIIPAYFEEKNIENVLRGYSQQIDSNGNPIDKSLYELIVVVNKRKSQQSDKTYEIVKNFVQNNPDLKIKIVDITFPDDSFIANVGMARKIAADLAIYRANQRKRIKQGSLYFITEDADTVSVDLQIVEKVIKKFDQRPEIEAVKGAEFRDPNWLKHFHPTLVRTYLGEIMLRSLNLKKEIIEQNSQDKILLSQDNSDSIFMFGTGFYTGGWHSAFRASTFAALGGYLPAILGEDLRIGELMKLYRGKEKEGVIFPNPKIIESISIRGIGSPRRFIEQDIKYIPTYAGFGNEDLERIIRTKSLEDFLGEIQEKERMLYSCRLNDNGMPELEFHLFVYHKILGIINYLIKDLFKISGDRDKDVVEITKRILRLIGNFSDKDIQLNSDFYSDNGPIASLNPEKMILALEYITLRTEINRLYHISVINENPDYLFLSAGEFISKLPGLYQQFLLTSEKLDDATKEKIKNIDPKDHRSLIAFFKLYLDNQLTKQKINPEEELTIFYRLLKVQTLKG